MRSERGEEQKSQTARARDWASIARDLARRGTVCGPKHGIKSGIDYAVVVARLKAGERSINLAREYGVTRSAISQGAHKHGWDGRKGIATPGRRRAAVIALANLYSEAQS